VVPDKVLAADDLSALFNLDMVEQPTAPLRRRREPAFPVPKDPEPVAKARRTKTSDTSNPPSLILTVDVFIPPAAPRMLGVVVADGGSPGRNITTTLAFGSQTLGETLGRAREFVEHAIENLFGSQWTRWFQACYGWQFSTIGFDTVVGMHLRAPIPLNSSLERTLVPKNQATKPPRGVRANGRLRDKKPTPTKT
jgi:hypothetical protein